MAGARAGGIRAGGAGLGTATSVLVRKPTAADPLLMNDLINRAKTIGEDRFAMGTATGGLLILDGRGTLIQRFSSAEGLQNNDIQSIMSDQDANLWLGLDNGIAFIHYNTSVKLIRPVKDNQLLSNVVKVFDQKLFIGTSNGLYSIPLDASIPDISQLKGPFSEVGNTKGQVWSLEDVDHDLLLGLQDGANVIRDDKAAPVLTRQGVRDVKVVERVGAGGRGGAGTAGSGSAAGTRDRGRDVYGPPLDRRCERKLPNSAKATR